MICVWCYYYIYFVNQKAEASVLLFLSSWILKYHFMLPLYLNWKKIYKNKKLKYLKKIHIWISIILFKVGLAIHVNLVELLVVKTFHKTFVGLPSEPMRHSLLNIHRGGSFISWEKFLFFFWNSQISLNKVGSQIRKHCWLIKQYIQLNSNFLMVKIIYTVSLLDWPSNMILLDIKKINEHIFTFD